MFNLSASTLETDVWKALLQQSMMGQERAQLGGIGYHVNDG